MKYTTFTTPSVCLIIMGIFCGFVEKTLANDPNDTPVSEEQISHAALYAAESTYTNLVETTYDDTNWALVVSDAILREDVCTETGYEKTFGPQCFGYNRYWELPANSETGEAFPMDIIGIGTLDSIYVREGYYFQLYTNTSKPSNPSELMPYGPSMAGPQYVSLDHWEGRYEFEEDTFFVEGDRGGLKDYSIIIFSYDPNMLTKTSDVDKQDCRSPEQSITYTICYENTSGSTLEDAYVIDWFPTGVDFPAGEDHYVYDGNSIVLVEGDPNYNSEDHYYYWELGDVTPGQQECLNLEVKVNQKAEPGSILHNVAELWKAVYDANGLNPIDVLIDDAFEDTQVCCWGDDPNIIYVDRSATGINVGTSWQNAYTDLADALRRATESDCSQAFKVYVAEGSYDPNQTDDMSFVLPDNCSVYGGFPSGGCDFENRNPKRYETILTGLIDGDNIPDADVVVTMGDETLLDGCTVTRAYNYCVSGNSVDFSIVNSTIENSEYRGIRSIAGNIILKRCHILDNDSDGIFHQGEGFTLDCENCWIRRNKGRGVYCLNSTPAMKNSIVTESDLSKAGNAGIFMLNPTNQPVLYNLTIAHNKSFGIAQAGGPLPDVKNSVVYHNDGPALAGFSADAAASYCCIEDCNSVNNNINLDPKFVYFDPNNVRIMSDSPCHDSGLTLQENYAQVDMDNRARVLGTAVDRGAYEIECEDTSNSFDTNHDGLVNYIEFATFSQAWLSRDPNDPSLPSDPNFIDPNEFTNWNPSCDLNGDYTVNLPDIVTFIDDAPWLWRACWYVEEDLTETTATASSSEMLLMSSSSLMLSSEAQTVTETTVNQEKSTQQQFFDLASSIVLLEEIWQEESDIQQKINLEDWQKFMDALYQNLAALHTKSVQIE